MFLGASVPAAACGLLCILSAKWVGVSASGGASAVVGDGLFGSGRLEARASMITLGLQGVGVLLLALGAVCLVVPMLVLLNRPARDEWSDDD